MVKKLHKTLVINPLYHISNNKYDIQEGVGVNNDTNKLH